MTDKLFIGVPLLSAMSILTYAALGTIVSDLALLTSIGIALLLSLLVVAALVKIYDKFSDQCEEKFFTELSLLVGAAALAIMLVFVLGYSLLGILFVVCQIILIGMIILLFITKLHYDWARIHRKTTRLLIVGYCVSTVVYLSAVWIAFPSWNLITRLSVMTFIVSIHGFVAWRWYLQTIPSARVN